MTDKEQATWNNSDEYGKYLIGKVIPQIDIWRCQKQYSLVAEQIKNIYCHLAQTIEMCVGKDYRANILTKIKSLDKTRFELEMLKTTDRTIYNIKKEIELTFKADQESFELYAMVMEAVDKAGFLISKNKVDDRPAIMRT